MYHTRYIREGINGIELTDHIGVFGAFQAGGDGLYGLLEEFYWDSDNPLTNDTWYHKIYLVHVTKSGALATPITQTDHAWWGGEDGGGLTAETFPQMCFVGCYEGAHVLVYRRRFINDAEPEGRSQVQSFFGTALKEEVTDVFLGSIPFSYARHFYGNYSLALDFNEHVHKFSEGEFDNGGSFPSENLSLYSCDPFENGVIVTAHEGSYGRLLDIDGNEQVVTEYAGSNVAYLMNSGWHLQRPYFTQRHNGGKNFTEIDLATGESATGDIEWPDEFVPSFGAA